MAESSSASSNQSNIVTRLSPVLYKLDQLLLLMLSPESGLLVKQQKYFRVSVPQACTGQELVQWLLDKLQLDDIADAMHFASLLVQYGYIFPVIEQSTQVKDDNSLYRVQIPYFWASHVGKADNVEYGSCRMIVWNNEFVMLQQSTSANV